MPHDEARAWWADVQHVRESIERRRAPGVASSHSAEQRAAPLYEDGPSESFATRRHDDWATASAGRGRRSREEATTSTHGASRELAQPEGTGRPTYALASPRARRTVQIAGPQSAAPSPPRMVEVERRRPPRRPAERLGPRPDRIALWAVILCFFLILVAATSSQASAGAPGGPSAAPLTAAR